MMMAAPDRLLSTLIIVGGVETASPGNAERQLGFSYSAELALGVPGSHSYVRRGVA